MSSSRIVIVAALVGGAFLLGRLSTSTNRLSSKLAAGQQINLLKKDEGFDILVTTPENQKAMKVLMGSRGAATVTTIGSDYFEAVSKTGRNRETTVRHSIPFHSVISISIYEMPSQVTEAANTQAKPTTTLEQSNSVLGEHHSYEDALHGNASQPN